MVWVTSTALPVRSPMPAVALVMVPASAASSPPSISLSFPLSLSFCAAAMLLRDRLDGLLWEGLEERGVAEAWLRVAAANA